MHSTAALSRVRLLTPPPAPAIWNPHCFTKVSVRILTVKTVGASACVVCLTLSAGFGAPKKLSTPAANEPAVLWQDPSDIANRDLTWGPGGAAHQPHGPFRFDKEDLHGTSAKFVVTDADGTKWKVKLGAEAHPETVASRLVWAAGYYADQEYYLPSFRLDGIPAHLRRGEKYIEPNGVVHGARLKRYLKGEEKDGTWNWSDNPFFGTREFNGLRIMMALINNWDLKDDNNAIRDYEGKRIYLVSDLGASFGTTSRRLTRAAGKGNLENYAASKFIAKVKPPVVSFGTPSRPALPLAFDIPDFTSRVNMEWIGKDIPIADARWIGSILAKLSPRQIQDAFTAAGYSPREVAGFSDIVEERIDDLNHLPGSYFSAAN